MPSELVYNYIGGRNVFSSVEKCSHDSEPRYGSCSDREEDAPRGPGSSEPWSSALLICKYRYMERDYIGSKINRWRVWPHLSNYLAICANTTDERPHAPSKCSEPFWGSHPALNHLFYAACDSTWPCWSVYNLINLFASSSLNLNTSDQIGRFSHVRLSWYECDLMFRKLHWFVIPWGFAEEDSHRLCGHHKGMT